MKSEGETQEAVTVASRQQQIECEAAMLPRAQGLIILDVGIRGRVKDNSKLKTKPSLYTFH